MGTCCSTSKSRKSAVVTPQSKRPTVADDVARPLDIRAPEPTRPTLTPTTQAVVSLQSVKASKGVVVSLKSPAVRSDSPFAALSRSLAAFEVQMTWISCCASIFSESIASS